MHKKTQGKCLLPKPKYTRQIVFIDKYTKNTR